MASREQYVFLAKLAEQAERYEEMVSFMEKVVVTSTVVDSSEGLTAEERNLLSVAYKNLIGARRASWRIVTSIEQKEEKNSEENIDLIRNYKTNIEGDLTEICQGILKLLDSKLVPTATTGESKVFYLKMKGDYHRYLAEFMSGKDKLKAGEDTLKAYKTAQEIADKELIPTHPLKLGLALNFSVFYYEIAKSPDKACNLAKKAYEEAVAEMDTLSEDSSKDSTLIIQLLRDNLTLWTVDMQEDDLFEIKEAE